MYLSYSLSLSDYLNPFMAILNSDIIPLSQGTLTIEEYYFKSSILNTDLGWILDSMVTEYSFDYDFSRRSNQAMPKSSELMFTSTFTISNVQEIFTRKYIKIQAILAVVGGFIKFLLIIVGVFNNYIVEIFFSDEIIMTSHSKYDHPTNLCSEAENIRCNNLSIIKPLNLNKKLNYNFSTKKTLANISNSQLPKSLNLQDDNIKEIKSTELKKEESSNNILFPINFKHLLCICYYKNRKNLIDKLRKNFRMKLDAKNIFYIFHKIKFIEKILLTKNQRKLEKIAIHKKIIDKLNYDNTEKQNMHEKFKNNNKKNYLYLINELKNSDADDSKMNERIFKYFEEKANN